VVSTRLKFDRRLSNSSVADHFRKTSIGNSRTIDFSLRNNQTRSYNPNLNSFVLPIVHTPPPDYVCEISPEPIADNPATIESLTKETTAHDRLSLPHPATPLVSYPYLMNSEDDRLDVFQARGDRHLNIFIKGRVLVLYQAWVWSG
jgi:hypothetical protein